MSSCRPRTLVHPGSSKQGTFTCNFLPHATDVATISIKEWRPSMRFCKCWKDASTTTCECEKCPCMLAMSWRNGSKKKSVLPCCKAKCNNCQFCPFFGPAVSAVQKMKPTCFHVSPIHGAKHRAPSQQRTSSWDPSGLHSWCEGLYFVVETVEAGKSNSAIKTIQNQRSIISDHIGHKIDKSFTCQGGLKVQCLKLWKANALLNCCTSSSRLQSQKKNPARVASCNRLWSASSSTASSPKSMWKKAWTWQPRRQVPSSTALGAVSQNMLKPLLISTAHGWILVPTQLHLLTMGLWPQWNLHPTKWHSAPQNTCKFGIAILTSWGPYYGGLIAFSSSVGKVTTKFGMPSGKVANLWNACLKSVAFSATQSIIRSHRLA